MGSFRFLGVGLKLLGYYVGLFEEAHVLRALDVWMCSATVVVKGQSHWKQLFQECAEFLRPSIDEASKTFIQLQPIATNVVEFLLWTESSKPFPFVLAMGNMQQISQSFFSISLSEYGSDLNCNSAKMATARTAYFKLQKCSSQTNGWRHRHYLHIFYSLWFKGILSA